MSDVLELAADLVDERIAAGVVRARQPVPPGIAGECDDCGETMPRLIGGRCGFCRDGRVPPPDWVPPTIAQPVKEPVMSNSKSITFVATGVVLEEIKRRTADGTSNNRVALDLVEAGLAAVKNAAPAPTMPYIAAFETPMLLAEIERRIGEAVSAHVVRDAEARVATAVTDAQAAHARAEAAEARLASIRAAIG